MRFTIGLWAVSRLVIAAVFWLTVRSQALHALGNWDGAWYGAIVAHGYEFLPDGRFHDVAFFPLFPLLSFPFARLGLEWPIAGALVANAGFLAGLCVTYRFASEAFDRTVARWTIATACLVPLSLFGSVAYAEGLFLVFSACALLAYRSGRFVSAGVFAALASATRPLGAVLAVALIVAAIAERRNARDVLACVTGLLGIAAFAIYCGMRFHDPLAFVHAQTAWRDTGWFDAPGWLGLARGMTEGRPHDWLSCILIALAIGAIVGTHRALGLSGMLYAAFVLLAILVSGAPISIDRLLFPVVPVLCAAGTVFRRLPPLGYAALGISLILLIMDTARFARFVWVA